MNRLLLLVVALTMLAPGLAVCQSPTIDLQVTLGFSNTFRPARWTPLTITVSNRGRDVSGFLEVRTRDGDEFRDNLFDKTHRRRVDLSRDSRKRVHFTVLLSNVANPLLIRMVADGTVLANTSVDLRTQFTASRLLVVVSRDANLDYLNDSDGMGIRVLYPHPELLPDHWRGYHAVAAVVVHGVSLEQLNTRQYEALRKWIAQGGTLAVSGDADYAWLRTPRMIDLLPASPVGMIAVDDPASMRNVFGRPFDITAPFHVNQLSASNARITVRAAHIPLVVESQFGRGRVLYLTFDVARAPFDRWPGMQRTWFELLQIGEAPALDPLVDARPSPVTELVALQSADFPGHGTLLLFLALYLGVLATGYRFAPVSGARRWLLPLATWAAPLLFAPAAYFLFGPVLFESGASLTVVSVIEPLGESAYAHVQIDLGIYANRDADDARAATLSYTGVEPTLHTPASTAEPGSSTRVPSNWIFSEGAQRAVVADTARRYTLHLLEGEDVIDFDLRATVDRPDAGDDRRNAPPNANAPRLTIRNNSGRALRDAWLIAGGRAWWVGDIAAHGTTTYRVDSEGFDLNSRSNEWWERLERHPTATPANMVLLKSLIARKDRTLRDPSHAAYPGLGTAVLIASTGPALLPTGISAGWQHTARTLVLLPMPAASLVKDESSVTDL